MSDDRDREPDAPERGVFGNLPDARPGTRSPRRDSARAGRKADTAKASAAKPKAATPKAAKPGPQTPRERPAPKPPREPAPRPEEPQGGGGLEDIAWAGVAAAAEAATIGVRLASRAIEALRGNAEKE
jgi:hypothetical protein